MTDAGATQAKELFFVTPTFAPGQHGGAQQGLMALDERGAVVWFQPLNDACSNLQVQQYRGEPVLTWWHGQFVFPPGVGQGEGVIADRSYRPIATVRGGNGLQVDLHELLLTPEGSALITAYRMVPADLRAFGGPEHGLVFEGVLQEIDVASGRLLFEWRSLDHVALAESYAPPGNRTFDYIHLNSVDVDPDDNNLVVSARNTWAVYKIDRSTGAVLWRLGGKRSDFRMAKETRFAWQHDARVRDGGSITIFDDGAAPPVESRSRAIEVTVDASRKTARLTKEFIHPAHLLADSQGSFRVLPHGGAIVGWGSEPYFSHFDPGGELLRDGRLPADFQSYRAFRTPWTATPTGAPDIAVEGGNMGHTVYVSWNGATEVATWQVLSGTSPTALTRNGAVPKGGFETAITVHPKGDHLAVQALDAKGRTLGTSQIVHL